MEELARRIGREYSVRVEREIGGVCKADCSLRASKWRHQIPALPFAFTYLLLIFLIAR